MNLSAMFGADERPDTMPSQPEAAFYLGCVYQRLGGHFSISSNGRRSIGRPLYGDNDELPQLPNAHPRERFDSAAEWEGAIKLIDGLIRRMSSEDKDYLFAAFAPVAIDPRKLAPSIEEPRRGEA